MANHPSALKRQRQSEKKRNHNRVRTSTIAAMTKEFNAADKAKKPALFKVLQSKIAKFGQKGNIHKNTAARMIAGLTRALSR
jgi:small subunit ribosomal protein S20